MRRRSLETWMETARRTSAWFATVFGTAACPRPERSSISASAAPGTPPPWATPTATGEPTPACYTRAGSPAARRTMASGTTDSTSTCPRIRGCCSATSTGSDSSALLVLNESRRHDAVGIELLLGFQDARPAVAEVRGPPLRRVEGDEAGEVALAAVVDGELARHVQLGQGTVQEARRHAGEDAPTHHEVAVRVHEEGHVGGAGVGRPEEDVAARSQYLGRRLEEHRLDELPRRLPGEGGLHPGVRHVPVAAAAPEL